MSKLLEGAVIFCLQEEIITFIFLMTLFVSPIKFERTSQKLEHLGKRRKLYLSLSNQLFSVNKYYGNLIS